MAVDPARAKSLFLEASDLASPAERAAYLDRECGGEAELRARVVALLAAHDKAGPFPEPNATTAVESTSYETLPGTATAAAEAAAETRTATAESVENVQISDLGMRLADEPLTREKGWDAPTAKHEEEARAERSAKRVADQVIAGRYTLLEPLGEGGMGTVYRAEQTQPVKRQVALKLIKIGMDSRAVPARFDAERQALALMDHPNIARVYDGGTTAAGQPFFVMELVEGKPITEYCDQRRLSVRARLELFVSVCQAVQHAHQKGIIHRDLKPSNVMVSEVDGRPTPKVIDFGVAKATEQKLTDMSLVDTGAIVGTPTYMSPEQADPSSMDIDTRTDVYALGVILYELLAGSPPIDAKQFKRGAILEMLRMVREVDPSRPSTKVSKAEALPNIAASRNIDPAQLKRALQGDLDWVVMKALEKDRTRRYETVNGFAADISRHLAYEPVLAAPPSRSYRLRKFVRRNRAGVIAASLVLLALVAGVTGTTLGLFEAKRQEGLANKRELGERLAKQEALEAAEKERLATKKALAAAEEERKAKETVEDVLGFVEDNVFAAARPNGQAGGLGYDVKLADAIGAALPSIETRFRNKPLTEARLRRTIGTSFHFLGKPEISMGQFEAARSLYTRELGPDHPDTLGIMNRLSVVYSDLGQTAEALKLREETLALRKAKLGPDHPDTVASRGNLALSYLGLGRPAEAVKLAEETLALLKAKLGPDDPETLTGMQILVLGYANLGRHAEAVKLAEEALALMKTKPGPEHPETIRSMHNLSAQYAAAGRHAEALKLGEEALALRKAKLGIDHPQTLNSMRNVAAFLAAVGRHADALKLREETLPLQKTRLGPDHHETLATMINLANIYESFGRHADALKLREETLGIQKTKLGPGHPDTLTSMHNLAIGYLAAGRTKAALALLEKAGNLKDTASSSQIAALQAWFGQDEAYAVTRKRFLAFDKGTNDSVTARGAAQAGALRPSNDPAELEAVLTLGRKAVELNKGEWELLALGMAEFRNGHFAAADEALVAASKAGKDVNAAGIAAFYRAMSLFQQGKKDEARKLATEAAAKMKPLPKDEQSPLLDGATSDHLVLWLAYKEAKAMIGFDPPPAPATADGK
ncbi:MAG: tetratricopeptide repeat protein [Isosphaeraceae bacterium]